MLDASVFKSEILEPVLQEFKEQPDSLHKGFCAIWSLDSYASHCAFQGCNIEELTSSQIRNVEEKFKNKLQASPHDDAWRFRLVRQASNATKHAISKKTNADVTNSGRVEAQEIIGWASYFGASHWGNQVVINVSWTFDENRGTWFDGKDCEVKPGPTFAWVPLLDIVDQCKNHIERGI